jgi:4-aminobutyrate aminotransferase
MSTQTQEFVHVATPETHARFGPKFVGVVPGPRAKKVVADDDLYLSPSYTRGYPLVVKRGYGCRIEGGAGAGGAVDSHVGHGFLL